MGNLIDGSLQINSNELLRSKKLAFAGVNTLQVADRYNDTITPLSSEGWEDLGDIEQISPDKKYDILELANGWPSTSKGGIVTGMSMSIGVTYSNPTLQGLDYANASNYAMQVNTGGTAKTVTSGSTKDKLVFSSAPDYQPNELLEVDLSSGTSYGIKKQIAFVIKVVGNNVFISRLSQAPKSGAAIKRVNGYGADSQFVDSATLQNSGVLMTEGATESPEVRARIFNVNVTTRSIFLTYIEQAEVRMPVALKRTAKEKELMTAGFTLMVIPQYGNFTDRNGQALTGVPYLCQTGLLPQQFTVST